MNRWMCDIKVKDRVASRDERETRNGGQDISTTQEQVVIVCACVM